MKLNNNILQKLKYIYIYLYPCLHLNLKIITEKYVELQNRELMKKIKTGFFNYIMQEGK